MALLLPRGNRETSLAAALALLHTIGPERRQGGEAIFAAVDRKQAGIGFREAAGRIREDKRLVAAVNIYDAHNAAKKLLYRKDASYLEVISGDGASQHRRTPGFLLADEIHIWKARNLWEALTTGLEKIDDSLVVVASTAGRGAGETCLGVLRRRPQRRARGGGRRVDPAHPLRGGPSRRLARRGALAPGEPRPAARLSLAEGLSQPRQALAAQRR